MNEKRLVEPLLSPVLEECVEVELLAGDSGFESNGVFEALEYLRTAPLVAWRCTRGQENPPNMLTVRDHIDVGCPEWMRAVYERLRTWGASSTG